MFRYAGLVSRFCRPPVYVGSAAFPQHFDHFELEQTLIRLAQLSIYPKIAMSHRMLAQAN